VPKNPHEKELQRALLQWKRPEKRRLVMEALHKAGREDLIGYGPDCLLRPIRPVKAETPEKKGVKVDRKNGKAAPKTGQKGRGDRKVPARQGKAPTKKKR
jgi:hypothetical protein